ncbi:hypothetical protein ASG94_02520 [Nocardioides sp. Soil805]|nr:hypothetical protein ASG94_02520 [Nocardioides sp. Soil805]
MADSHPTPTPISGADDLVDPTALAVRGRPRSAAYRSVTHGIHRRRLDGAGQREEWLADLRGWQLLLTGHGCFTALTAARIRGWELPPLPAATPVFVAMQLDDPRPIRDGIRTSRHPDPIEHETVAGLRCATAAETLLACARWLSPLDLVVLVDNALQVRDVTVEELRDVCRPRRRGRSALLAALVRVDGRSESSWETLLRLLHVAVGADVVPQREVRDADGVLVARVDLHLVGTTSVHEFDGGHHREPNQHRDDLRRERRLSTLGRVRRGYTASDVVQRPIGVLRDVDVALGREHDPRRIRPWLAMLRESLYTPSGREAFLRRVGTTSVTGGRRRRRGR